MAISVHAVYLADYANPSNIRMNYKYITILLFIVLLILFYRIHQMNYRKINALEILNY